MCLVHPFQKVGIFDKEEHTLSSNALGCRHVMNDVSENSLVLVDELGKGTEPMAGIASFYILCPTI